MSLSPAPSTTSNSDTGSVYHEDEILSCLWQKCNRQFDDAESLYSHLSVDHVGRKSTGNLCLECHWDDCDVRTTKRDHITSHLRVHVPLKPHICETCKKAFKRPQDLKKHYKIHSEYHQQQLTNLKNHRITKKLLISPLTPPYYHPYNSIDNIDHYRHHHHHHHQQQQQQHHHHHNNQYEQKQHFEEFSIESPLVMTTSEYTTPPSPSSYNSSPRNPISSLSSSSSSSSSSSPTSSINSFPSHNTNTITSPTLNSINSISFPRKLHFSPTSPSTTNTTINNTNMNNNMNYHQETPQLQFYSHPYHTPHIPHQSSISTNISKISSNISSNDVNNDNNNTNNSPRSFMNERLPPISSAIFHSGSRPIIEPTIPSTTRIFQQIF